MFTRILILLAISTLALTQSAIAQNKSCSSSEFVQWHRTGDLVVLLIPNTANFFWNGHFRAASGKIETDGNGMPRSNMGELLMRSRTELSGELIRQALPSSLVVEFDAKDCQFHPSDSKISHCRTERA